MSGLIGKLKEKVRGRSGSESADRPSTSRTTEVGDERFEPANNNYPVGTIPAHYYSPSPKVSLDNSAFHVHRGRQSIDKQARAPVLQSKNGATDQPKYHGVSGQHHVDERRYHQGFHDDQNTSSQVPITRDLDNRKQLDVTPPKIGNAETVAATTREEFPKRLSSKHALQQSPDLQSAKKQAMPSSRHDSMFDHPEEYTRSSIQTSNQNASHVPPTSVNKATAGLPSNRKSATVTRSGGTERQRQDAPQPISSGNSDLANSAQLAGLYLEKSQSELEREKTLKSGNLRLPEGFNPNDTEETIVHEEQRPAVTHETIIKQRTEIVQEQITRDIHIHHYYTYVQPVKVVEVLPARHFYLDLETGVKTEVQPPKGWEMPANLRPFSPDISLVKATSRHYLVNEAHPTGLVEPPPVENVVGHENVRQKVHASGLA